MSPGDRTFYRWTLWIAVLGGAMMALSIGTGAHALGAAVVVACIVLLVAVVFVSLIFGNVRAALIFRSRRK